MNLILAFCVWLYLLVCYFYLFFKAKSILKNGYQDEIDVIKDKSYFYKTDDFALVNIIAGYRHSHLSKILGEDAKKILLEVRVVFLLVVTGLLVIAYLLPPK